MITMSKRMGSLRSTSVFKFGPNKCSEDVAFDSIHIQHLEILVHSDKNIANYPISAQDI